MNVLTLEKAQKAAVTPSATIATASTSLVVHQAEEAVETNATGAGAEEQTNPFQGIDDKLKRLQETMRAIKEMTQASANDRAGTA